MWTRSVHMWTSPHVDRSTLMCLSTTGNRGTGGPGDPCGRQTHKCGSVHM